MTHYECVALPAELSRRIPSVGLHLDRSGPRWQLSNLSTLPIFLAKLGSVPPSFTFSSASKLPTLDPRPRRRLDRGMKVTLFALFVALLMVGCGSQDPTEATKTSNTLTSESPSSNTPKDVVEDVTADNVEDIPNTDRTVKFHDNGQKALEANLKDGKMHGLFNRWYENGQKESETNYKNGKPHGLWILWYKNGQKWIEGNNKDGKLDGLVTTWYENGQKQAEENHKDGKFHGLVIGYREDGTESSRQTYKDGELVLD